MVEKDPLPLIQYQLTKIGLSDRVRKSIDRWKFDEGQNIYMISKYLSTNPLLIAKGKMITFEWRNLVDTNLINDENQCWANWHHTPPDTLKRTKHRYCDISHKKLNQNLITRKHQTYPNWDSFYKTRTDLNSSKDNKVKRDKERENDHCQLKMTTEI